jgi:DNA-binding transcriptional ArsR family regulator
VRLLRLCRRDLKVRTGAKAVLYALADHADDEGVTWVAEAALMTAAQTSRSALYRSLDALKAAGLVKRERVNGRKGWRVLVSEDDPPPGHTDVPPAGQVAKRTSPTSGTEKSHQRDLEVPLAGPEASVKHHEARECDAVLPLGDAAPEPKPKRKTRLPEDFALTEAMRAFAVGKGMPPSVVDDQFEAFCDWHGPRKETLALSWPATWRSWCRIYPKLNGNGGNNSNGSATATGPDGVKYRQERYT